MGCTNCSKGGCGVLSVHDWLENMMPPNEPETQNIYEVRFKSTRKGYYRNINGLELYTGDYVLVESDRGYDMGAITMGGVLVGLQMRKKKIDPEHVLRIYRRANEEDIKRLESLRERELEILTQTRAITYSLELDMKLSDVEYQADGTKAIFYYTADQRVDFRELIRILAQEFKIRVEMRQIGLRQEAGLIGGIGSCGRELCCSSWLTDFRSVNTTAARYQNISLNPSKITGLCGRLKCCLNYELETYLDALSDIPDVKEIETELGVAYLQKTDIFKQLMWYSYGGDANWTKLTTTQVAELYELNLQGVRPPSLAAIEEVANSNAEKVPVLDFIDVVGQSNLHEKSENAKKKRKKRPQPKK